MAKAAWGIDVSRHSVKAARLEVAGGAPRLTAADIVALDPERPLRVALSALKTRLGIAREPVVLSIPGQSTLYRLVTLPADTRVRVEDVVRAEAQFPFDVDDLLIDYQLVDDTPGQGRQAIVFAARKDDVERLLEDIAPAGLDIAAVQFGPVALTHFLRLEREDDKPVLAVDMGAENADLIIVDGPKLWIRSLPVTGHHVTRALQKSFDIPFAEAEDLKRRAPHSPQARKIYHAIQPALEELVVEIRRSLEYYATISNATRFRGLVLFGGGARAIDLEKHLSHALQMPVAGPFELRRVVIAGSVPSAQTVHGVAALAPAIGLALQGVGLAKSRTLLLPPSHLRRKIERRKQPWVLGIAIALYVFVAALWYAWRAEALALRGLVDRAETAERDAAALASGLADARKLDAIERPLRAFSSVGAGRDAALRIMNSVIARLPDNRTAPDEDRLWITDWRFEEEPAGEAPPGRALPADKRLRVTISGAVLSAGRTPQDAARRMTDTLVRGLATELDVSIGAATASMLPSDVTPGESASEPLFYPFTVELRVPLP